ncbi:MAG: glutamine--fructose-6-phosphate transaminase (isomerizing) [Candidatus Verstraetearchaeota archaeon]|jgi:glucosamine--fructose-6-phosphate aminotransferase (isomerizing)|nr:glutamine--fructose-6-phosphate transaminase (isomerizing) [Candidatus Verstraetearchaeota archaeon]
MCGIIGCILSSGLAAPILFSGLKRLEYRGYDSAGMATIYGGKLYLKKDSGKIDDINSRLNFMDMPGSLGIAHTRWATHGAPSRENAHPHLDCSGTIAVVHNGVIENFLELKRELEDRGHKFTSRTDTEVIPHLIEEGVKSGLNLYEAVLQAVRRLRGSYAIAVISTVEPDKIICARNESPLIVGIGDGAYYCASDIPAILEYTRNFISMDNGEIAVLSLGGVEFRRISDGEIVLKKPFTVDWSIELAEKQGYPHFMLKEIYEQPLSLRNALRLQEQYLDLLSRFIDRGERVFLVACGTSYHACLAASYMFSKIARVAAFPVVASEFLEQYGDSVGIDDVILAVSQSGETYDVLRAVDHARMRAATVLGLTNTVGSTLTRVSRAYIVQQSGPEIGVAATKTFTSQLIVLAQLAMRVANLRGKLSQQESDSLRDSLKGMPEVIGRVLNSCADNVKLLAKRYAKKNLFLFLGRGINVATALEGRLKLLEITYTPSLAFSAAESKHGPISIVEKGVPVIFIAPRDSTRKEIIGNIMEMKARGAEVIALCEEDDREIIGLADHHIPMPKGIPDVLSPIPYIVPLQLFAYYVAVEKGLDPDKPRNLAKSVTVP